MPITSCGFSDQPGFPGYARLVRFGPTLGVCVGFDATWRPNTGTVPNLPVDPIWALVDTGATISCIDTSLVDSLGLPFVGMRDFSGMAGSSKRSMHLAQIRVPNLDFNLYGEFAAVDLIAGGQPHAVLLGRSFLRRFRMTYEGRTGNVIIENESDPITPTTSA